MASTSDYLHYAAECDELARKMPQHAKVLKEMAEAWRLCASNSDKSTKAKA